MRDLASLREEQYTTGLWDVLIEACCSEGAWEESTPHCRLIRSGDPMSWIFALDEGVIAWRVFDREGRPALLTWYEGPSVIGIPEVLLGTAAVADLVTLTRCKFTRVPGSAFRELVNQFDGVVLRTVVHRLASEVHHYFSRVRSLQLLTAEEMFLDYLRNHIRQAGATSSKGVRRLGLPVTHAQMAEWLGVSPQYFSQVLARLEEEGVVRRERGWLLVREDLL